MTFRKLIATSCIALTVVIGGSASAMAGGYSNCYGNNGGYSTYTYTYTQTYTNTYKAYSTGYDGYQGNNYQDSYHGHHGNNGYSDHDVKIVCYWQGYSKVCVAL